ncbi:exodeoxyribonuclease V subunit alpha [Guyparkeria sp. GHLCS8-2]|uniref:exodeoxyribonuclease V subunit alpha n=1 Tax=Guyparkeria halopsychrophila TaxID=3139421 RepID=UPI0037CB5E3C
MSQHPALTDHAALRRLLDRWVAAGWLRPIDRAVADFLAHRAPEAAPLAQLAAVLASHQGGSGHVCLDLAAVRENPDFTLRMPPAEPTGKARRETDTPAAVLAGIDLADWQRALAEHPAVRTLRWQEDDKDHEGKPLILVEADRPQLYLRRYWQVEGRVAEGLAKRGAVPPPSPQSMRPVLDALYPGSNDTDATDWQKVACALAAHQPFSIITGGPGTGKTTTVVRLLATLTSLHLGGENGSALPRIALCAPTGKAAARLAESIGEKVREIAAIRADGFDAEHWPAVSAHLPDEVQTIHRLIGTRPLAEKPRHHRDNPLDLDIVVVDEASMVGMELMGQLVEALPARCRLVMLGDKDQLASVEAGAVLGELCHHADSAVYPAALRDYLQAASGQPVPNQTSDDAAHAGHADPVQANSIQADPVQAHIATLRVSHRFSGDSAIGALARAVNRGDLAGATDVLGAPDDDQASSEVDWLLDHPGANHSDRFVARMVEELRPWLSMITAQSDGFDPDSPQDEAMVVELFRRHNDFQLLCALRRGVSGVEGLNARVQDWLSREGLLPAAEQIGRSTAWYPGRPVIVTRNDAQLNLANGDMGLTLPTRLENGDVGLRVVFPAGPATARATGRPGRRFHWVSPTRLSEVETAFALTVHKSQGSEFTRVAMVMPERSNPILTRELLYTAITRAKQRFTLISPIRAGDEPDPQARAVLKSAVTSVTRRSGNLQRRLVQRLSASGSDDREWRQSG